MPKWTKPEPQREGERTFVPDAPIDVLLLGARGAVDWRARVIPELDAHGLVYHDPGGILVRTDRMPRFACVLVGLGDPGAGNHGIETWHALGHISSPYYGDMSVVVYRFGELGDAFTPHDKDQFEVLALALTRSRAHVALDPAEVGRACAARRATRYDDDVEIETNTTRRKRAKKTN